MKKNDIEINITTTADTSGAEEVEKSIFKVEEAAKEAERELDVLEAKRRKAERENTGGLTGVDLTKDLDGVGTKLADATGYGKELATAKALAKAAGLELTGAAVADAALITGSFAAIAASAGIAFKGVGDSLEDYKNLIARWREVTGKELDEGSQDVLAWAQVFDDVEQPIDQAIDKIGSLISSISEIVESPLESLKKLRKEIDGTGDLEASIKRAEDAKKALDGVIQARAAAGQIELASIYSEENERLKDQEKTLERIGKLRSTLGGLEQQGAKQEVEAAKLRGGDVGLAEANLLATELRTGLGKLEQDLAEVQAAAVTAQQQADAALVSYKAAIRDNLAPADIDELGKKVDAAQTAATAANQAVTDQSQVFEVAKTNLIRGAENELAKLEQEYDGKTTTAAKQAFDGIYVSLQKSFSEAPKAAIEMIQVNSAQVTEAATSKAVEVAAGIDRIKADVVTTLTKLTGNVSNLLGITRELASSVSLQGEQIDGLKQQIQQIGGR